MQPLDQAGGHPLSSLVSSLQLLRLLLPQALLSPPLLSLSACRCELPCDVPWLRMLSPLLSMLQGLTISTS